MAARFPVKAQAKPSVRVWGRAARIQYLSFGFNLIKFFIQFAFINFNKNGFPFGRIIRIFTGKQLVNQKAHGFFAENFACSNAGFHGYGSSQTFRKLFTFLMQAVFYSLMTSENSSEQYPPELLPDSLTRLPFSC
jgi:hypothetical protein